jgi:hypothetical protein
MPGRLSARILAVCLFAALLMLLVRGAALSADPPAWLSWSTGIDTDEGFYTLDARHEVLFHHVAPGNFHDRLLSPLLSLLQQGVFTLFGPTLPVARALCVLFGLLTVLLLWLALRRTEVGTATANAAALFLGFAPPFAFYNRLALQETPMVFWLVLAFWLCSAPEDTQNSRKRVCLLAFSGLAFGIGVIFKPFALLALPAFLWLWGGRKTRYALSPLGALAAILAIYLFAWYVPNHAVLARMGAFYREHQLQPHHWASLWLNIRRGLWGGERGIVPYLLALMPVPIVLGGWGIRRECHLSVFFALWLGMGVTFCLLSSYAPSRYYVLFFPPLAGLAALGWERLGTAARRVTFALFFLVSLLWYGQAWTHRTYERADASQKLAQILPLRSVVIGEFAPELCLDTPFAAAPVQPGLSNDTRPVERLHATVITVTRTPLWEAWWQQRYPGVIQPSHRIATFTLGGPRRYVVDVYSVE